MVVKCDIDFDNNEHGIYFAGQVLSGRVTLKADKPKNIQGISLKIVGYASTNWSESINRTLNDSSGKSTTKSETIYYRGHEDYIASLTYLYGSEASQTLSLAPGIHTYNFACHIPATCPSSFEGAYGHIRYIIKVALIRPWKFDQTYTKGFTVLKIMDLNYDSPLLRVPANVEVQKTYCCGPCRSDPMKMYVSLARSGFVPGQSIPITLTVENESRVPIEELKINLVMLVCYYSQTPNTACKNGRLTVAKLKGEGVPRNCNKQFFYELPVPATPPTCFNLCRILQIAYEVVVEATVKGMHASQVTSTPVTIGNVPLIGVIQQQPLRMQRNGLDNAAFEQSNESEVMQSHSNSATAPPMEPWNSNGNIPPPSYEEAVHVLHARINDDEKHDYGECDFAPRYTVFNMPVDTATTAPSDEVDGSKTENGTWL